MDTKQSSNDLRRATQAMLVGLERDCPNVSTALMLAALGYLASHVINMLPEDYRDVIGDQWIEMVKLTSGLSGATNAVGFGTQH